MPCDTQYVTTAMDLGKVDRKVLADALKADGWRVTTVAGAMVASRRGTDIRLDATGNATLTASNYSNRSRITREVLASYTRLATERTVSRYGFRKLGESTLADGTVELTFGRTMGGPTNRIGKVGL